MASQVTPEKVEGPNDVAVPKPLNDIPNPKTSMPEEKKEDDKGLAPPAVSVPSVTSPKKTPADSVLPVNMPNSMMSPNNRPPSRSSMSVASAGSGGGRTTTSRRGGRTRSRSPTGNIHSYGGRPPSTTPSVPSEVGNLSPRNPSAAAAAAAAAAKSFRNPGARSGSYYPPYGSSGPSRDPYARQQGRQDPYASSRYPGGPPPPPGSAQRQPPQRPPSSAAASYPGQPPQRPHSRSSASYPGGPPPPGYYDPHNPSRNPPSSSHHPGYHPRSSGSRNGPPPPPGSSRYDSQPPPPTGPDGRPLSRNGDSQAPYGYNPYHRNSGAPSSSRGGMPPGSVREYPPSSQYPAGANAGPSGRYGGPPGSSSSSGPVDSGEYGRQHHSASRHTPPPHHRHQYPAGGPPSSSRTSRQQYPGSSSSSSHHPSYRHGDPNARGPPPPHYRGGPPPSSQQRGGPPPGHPDYHRYHAQQQAQRKESMAKSTRTVMGTATPLHLNKGGPIPPNAGPQAQPGSYKSNPGGRREPAASRRGTAASVFRGRPGPVQGGATPNSNNPKSILDSLDTPSNSFEEKKSSRGDKDSDQLSPEEPPKLRGSGNNASGTTELVFDPQRSPKSKATGAAGLMMAPPELTNSLDMAGSFELFNKSFEFDDGQLNFNVSGGLDAAILNASTSFELKTSGSRSPSSDNPLQLSSSNGTFKLNASMSGGAMFSMSPTNSFGNGPTASFPTGAAGGSLTVLGGNSENGRSSPSQVLDLYKSSGSIEEADLRLSASLGSPMIGASHSYSSSRPFATGMEGGPQQPNLSGGDYKPSSNRRSHLSPRPQRRFSGQGPYRPQRATSAGPPNKDGTPRFYNFLRNNRDAFLDCTFLLPELKTAVEKSREDKRNGKSGTVSNESTPKRGQSSRNRYDRMPTQAESVIARRRIMSAICAFGGTFVGNRGKTIAPTNSSPDESTSNNKTGVSKANSQSIFREKSSEPATVTPSSSGASTVDGSKIPSAQAKYDGALPTRYYESDNRLSWEFEENPPIETTSKNPEDFQWCQSVGAESPIKKLKTEGTDDQSDDDETSEEGEDGSKESKDEKGESPKMRYRCKLCGQPKTDHVCPYQQSLVRNIGVMVKPAVNAFTAAEPGQLAPDLKEMNNMAISAASLAAENAASADNSSSSRPTPDRSSVRGAGSRIEGDEAAQVTPESLRSGGGPNHMMSPNGRSRVGTPATSSRRGGRAGTPATTPSKKRSHARMVGGNAGDQTDLLFVEEMELKTEQFRTVTPSKAITENPDAYTYPALPLPYAQRKRLSDNLFSLSKEIPQLTDECAAVLREARERDLWDLAVAELMTQVVVVVHCHEGDNTFEGLRRYLLTLGFTC